MLPAALHPVGVRVLLCVCSSLATPPLFYSPLEGSTDEEELITLRAPLPTGNFSFENETTAASPSREEAAPTNPIMDFLEENLLLILVASILILLLFLIICGAFLMSRRQKVNAYYPSAFPSKMYVDHRDKTGGAKLFNEVEDKAAPEQEGETVDSHKQLQADIMRAAKSLRTPSKCERGESGQKEPEHGGPDEASRADSSITDPHLLSIIEEKQVNEPPDCETAAAAAAAAEPSPPRPPQAGGDDAREPLISRSLRPSSLHIHNDSATLQLIAGEKTAF